MTFSLWRIGGGDQQAVFAGVNDTTAFIFALMAFAAGFLVRPFGALVFGRLGDMIGRKYTFPVTIVLMGLSTFAVGLLPTYASIGIAAPIILVVLRMLQGLALGGEYGGAATYVAEHAPPGKRGFHTGFIQSTATLGLLLSLVVVLGSRYISGDQFEAWGWRLPFLLSIFLLAISTWIRMSMEESPAFVKMKAQGKVSKSPIRESFTSWPNLKVVLTALFSINAGQAVTFYTAQFYVLFFLTQMLKMDPAQANTLLIISVVIGAPFFVFFGWLSDRVGRKPILMIGLLLATVLYFPMFKALSHYANPQIDAASRQAPIVVTADPQGCTFQFDPVGKARFDSPCDKVKTFWSSKACRTARWMRQRDLRCRSPSASSASMGLTRRPCARPSSRLATRPRRIPRASTGDGGGADRRHDPDCHHDLWASGGSNGRAVPDPHPLHLHVPAVSHWQWLVRWLPADRVVRLGGVHRGYLLWAVVPGADYRGESGGGVVLPERDQGCGYRQGLVPGLGRAQGILRERVYPLPQVFTLSAVLRTQKPA